MLLSGGGGDGGICVLCWVGGGGRVLKGCNIVWGGVVCFYRGIILCGGGCMVLQVFNTEGWWLDGSTGV